MTGAGEIIGIAIMAGGTVAVICFADFIRRNLPEALGEESPEGQRLPGKEAGERPLKAGEPVTHTQHRRPQSHFRTER